jgi:hypothetical protein
MALKVLQEARVGKKEQVTIPEPTQDIGSLYRTVYAMKELVEILAGQRGQAYDAAVTWQDLLRLDKIREAEIPHDIGSRPIQRRR